MKIKFLFLICLFILIVGNFGIHADDASKKLVIKNGYIVPISSAPIEEGIILIENGIITDIGKNIPIPEKAEVIDASNNWILPGFIESHTTLGTTDQYGAGNMDETYDPDTAQMKIIDAINPFDKNIRYARSAGITTVMAAPGRKNVIGGQTAVLRLSGKTVEQMVLLSPAGVKMSLGEGPKTTYGSKGRLPSTRMGSAYVIRKALIEAKEYSQKWDDYREKYKKDQDTAPPTRDLRLEILSQVLTGELTVFIESYRVDDIMTSIRLIDEFKLKAVLVGCAEGYKVAEEIGKRKIPVIISPFGIGPRRMETKEINISNAAVLAQKGVKIVLKSEESLGMGNIRELPLIAALAVKGGLDRETALRAITLTAAEFLGVDDRIGSLEKGKEGNIVISDGDPLNYKTQIKRVLIQGKTVYQGSK
jgi:imidazolonepropionase-like amidohydrolase